MYPSVIWVDGQRHTECPPTMEEEAFAFFNQDEFIGPPTRDEYELSEWIDRYMDANPGLLPGEDHYE